jgi:two-component system, OmpR family, heavy metal sensor histidine kinase CusS
MLTFSLRTRMTALYFVVLALSFSSFAWISDYGFRRSIETTVDDASRANLESVQRVVVRAALKPPGAVREELDQLAGLWAGAGLLEVSEASGNAIFQSQPFAEPDRAVPGVTSSGTIFYTTNLDRLQYRVAARRVLVGSHAFVIRAAVPSEPFDQALDRFRQILKETLPVLIVLASLLGYWLSGRGLAPVNEIIRTARGIDVKNLSSRLSVPKARDELRLLTETLNEMLARIELSVERITRFTADASHDLRTPLSLIRSSSELALLRPRSGTEYRETLSSILAASEETTGLVENLLALARADAGAANLQFQRLDLLQRVRRTAEEARVLATAKGIRLVEQLPTDPVWVTADASAVERLLRILLENAVKYTPNGGEICVFFHNRDRAAHVEIRDTGIGIPAGDLPHIFERFYRADEARSRETGGSGLGLAIAQWVVQAHHGSISVRSAVGQGSTFSVSLPLAGPQAFVTSADDAGTALSPCLPE